MSLSITRWLRAVGALATLYYLESSLYIFYILKWFKNSDLKKISKKNSFGAHNCRKKLLVVEQLRILNLSEQNVSVSDKIIDLPLPGSTSYLPKKVKIDLPHSSTPKRKIGSKRLRKISEKSNNIFKPGLLSNINYNHFRNKKRTLLMNVSKRTICHKLQIFQWVSRFFIALYSQNLYWYKCGKKSKKKPNRLVNEITRPYEYRRNKCKHKIK